MDEGDTNISKYEKAAATRATKLGDIAYDKYSSGESGVLGSYSSALKEKLAARRTAWKERFDPLNMVQGVTSSRLLTTAMGKALGRNSADIDYFTRKSQGERPGSDGISVPIRSVAASQPTTQSSPTSGRDDSFSRLGSSLGEVAVGMLSGAKSSSSDAASDLLEKQKKFYTLVTDGKSILYPVTPIFDRLDDLYDLIDQRLPAGLIDKSEKESNKSKDKDDNESSSDGGGGGGSLFGSLLDFAGDFLGGKKKGRGRGRRGRGARRPSGPGGKGKSIFSKGRGFFNAGRGRLAKMVTTAKAAMGIGGAAAAGAAASEIGEEVLETGGKAAAAEVGEEVLETGGKAAVREAGTEVAEKGAQAVGQKVVAETAEQVAEAGAKKAAAKVGTEVAEAGAKKITAEVVTAAAKKVAGKAIPKLIGKSIPIIGAVAGLGFAVQKLMEGDPVGAGLEAVSGIGGPVTAIPATIAAIANDVYTEVYGIAPGNDPQRGERFSFVSGIVEQNVREMLGDKVEMKEDEAQEQSGEASPEKTPEAGTSEPSAANKPLSTEQLDNLSFDEYEAYRKDTMTRFSQNPASVKREDMKAITASKHFAKAQDRGIAKRISKGPNNGPGFDENYDEALTQVTPGVMGELKDISASPVLSQKTNLDTLEAARANVTTQNPMTIIMNGGGGGGSGPAPPQQPQAPIIQAGSATSGSYVNRFQDKLLGTNADFLP